MMDVPTLTTGELGWTTAMSLIVVGNTASERVAEKLCAIADHDIEFRGMRVRFWRHLGPNELSQTH
ncbi:MAG: hypothetical protein AAFR55_07525 [Pseudomonadota bacterium]